jgi:carboxymethylenebutenolidase
VIEQILDIPTGGGAMETFIVHPERGGPHPAVLMLMDAPGMRDELYAMARRLGTGGYCVLLPNLYYRAGRDTKFGPQRAEMGEPERDRMRAIRTKMTISPVMDDVAAMLRFLDGFAPARPGPVGVHGYCMSGPYALAAAVRHPERVAAAASFYGTWLVSDAVESPHLTLAARHGGELYIACAEHDELAPAADGGRAEGAVRRGGQPRRAGNVSRRASRLRVPRAAHLRHGLGRAALGAAGGVVPAADRLVRFGVPAARSVAG